MSNRSASKRHEKNVAGMNVAEALEKYAPDKKRIVTRLGKGRGNVDGVVIDNTTTIKYRRYSVAWGVPMDELGYSYWFSRFLQQEIMPWDPLIFCLSTYLPQARSFIHDSFLKMGDEVQYLVMLDSDVIPPVGAVAKLLTYKLPMVGGWYTKKDENPEGRHPVVYDFLKFNEEGIAKWVGRKEPGEGVEKVDGAGAGFWVMRRDVAEAIGKSPYDFMRSGEDLELCLKVKEAGFDMYIDWSMKAEHRGAFSY